MPATQIFWQAIAWSCIAFYAWADFYGPPWLKARKLPQPTKNSVEPSWGTQLPVAIKNMILINMVAVPMLYSRGVYRVENESLLRTLVSFFIHLCTSDIFFYSGHYAMHYLKTWPFGFLYASHKLHHSSFARCAIAG